MKLAIVVGHNSASQGAWQYHRDMIARLTRPDGTVEREWQTTRPDHAVTADRNCPSG